MEKKLTERKMPPRFYLFVDLQAAIARMAELQRLVLKETTPDMEAWRKLDRAKDHLYDQSEGRA